jgi:hypothetical protein
VLFAFTPPLCLLALLLTMALVALAGLLCLLTLALTPPLVVVVAVHARGPPPFAEIVADLPQLVRYTHLWLREYDIGGQVSNNRSLSADPTSVRLSRPIGRLGGGSRRREARRQAVGLELEERFGIA